MNRTVGNFIVASFKKLRPSPDDRATMLADMAENTTIPGARQAWADLRRLQREWADKPGDGFAVHPNMAELTRTIEALGRQRAH